MDVKKCINVETPCMLHYSPFQVGLKLMKTLTDYERTIKQGNQISKFKAFQTSLIIIFYFQFKSNLKANLE